MSQRVAPVLVVTAMWALVIFGAAAGAWQARTPAGWQLPPDADDTVNPLTIDAKLLATGRALFADKCRKCMVRAALATAPTRTPMRASEWT